MEIAVLKASLTPVTRLNCRLSDAMARMDAIDIYRPDFIPLPCYDGSYVVTPLPYQEQTLETLNKRMLDNVVVHEIPIFSVSNPANGRTVYIGEP